MTTKRTKLEMVDGKRSVKFDEVKSMTARTTGFNRMSVDIDMLDGRLLEWTDNSDRQADEMVYNFREYQERKSNA